MGGYICHVNEEIPGAFYIGREYRRTPRFLDRSPLANPHTVKDKGREGAIEAFRRTAFDRITTGTDPEFVEGLVIARGKPLACWCRKSTAERPACHGDVILELLNRYSDEQLHASVDWDHYLVKTRDIDRESFGLPDSPDKMVKRNVAQCISALMRHEDISDEQAKRATGWDEAVFREIRMSHVRNFALHDLTSILNDLALRGGE